MWIKHISHIMPTNVAGRRIDIRTRDGFEISHGDGAYPLWFQTGGRDDIVAYRFA